MEQLVIHPQTRAQIDAYFQAPAQAVLLVGPGGTGKLSLAKKIAESVLQLQPNGLDSHGYSYIIKSEDGKAIGIEAVRQLERFLSLKVPGRMGINRLVIIEDGHLLTLEAQNALLKTLEEPPVGTIVILTAAHSRSLLPTIRSRLQTITVRRPERLEIERYFGGEGFSDEQVSQTLAMSGGLPGLMRALLSEDDHPLRAAAQQARELLGSSVFERLVIVDSLARQKQLAADTINMLQQMAHLSLQTAGGPAASRWQKILRASYDAAEAIRTSAQLKLALTDMVLRF